MINANYNVMKAKYDELMKKLEDPAYDPLVCEECSSEPSISTF